MMISASRKREAWTKWLKITIAIVCCATNAEMKMDFNSEIDW